MLRSENEVKGSVFCAGVRNTLKGQPLIRETDNENALELDPEMGVSARQRCGTMGGEPCSRYRCAAGQADTAPLAASPTYWG